MPRENDARNVEETTESLYRRRGYVPRVQALPTAAVGFRGRLLVLEGGAGVADGCYVCLKALGGSYSWRLIISG